MGRNPGSKARWALPLTWNEATLVSHNNPKGLGKAKPQEGAGDAKVRAIYFKPKEKSHLHSLFSGIFPIVGIQGADSMGKGAGDNSDAQQDLTFIIEK